jgi:hypothetical protein
LTVRFGYSAAIAPLQYIRDNADVLRVLTTAATRWAEVTAQSGNLCVSANVSAADFGISSGATGPVLTVAAKLNQPIQGNGNATHIALTRSASATVILALTNCSAQTLVSGNFIDIASWTATNETEGEGLSEPEVLPPPETTFFGPGIGMDGLNPFSLGKVVNHRWAMRFRADHTGTLDNIRVYRKMGDGYAFDSALAGAGGYTAGSGDYGICRMRVFDDDGTVNHDPLQSSQRGTTFTVAIGAANGTDAQDAGWLIEFPAPKPTVTQGNIYHIVWDNTHADHTNHWWSLNNVSEQTPVPTPRQPRFPDDIYATLWDSTSDWTWEVYPFNCPIMDLGYTDDWHFGNGYMEQWSHTDNFRVGGANLVRQTMTVTGGARVVNKAFAKLYRVSGTGALTCRIKNSSGTTLLSTSLAASTIAIGTDTQIGYFWVQFPFGSDLTLDNGQTYYLEFSAALGTEYRFAILREGSSYGYHTQTYFSGGRAERSSDAGSSWVGASDQSGNPNTTQADLNFYLTN